MSRSDVFLMIWNALVPKRYKICRQLMDVNRWYPKNTDFATVSIIHTKILRVMTIRQLLLVNSEFPVKKIPSW